MAKTKTLKLTPQQTGELKKLFGHDVTELSIAVEEFNVKGSKAKMKVLKVNNVAVVRNSAMGMGEVVN